MTDRVDIFFKIPGVEEEQKMTHRCHPMGAVNRTKRKFPRAYDIRSVTYHDDYVKKFIPRPPEDFQFARYKVKMKKNRFGRLVNDKVEELDFGD